MASKKVSHPRNANGLFEDEVGGTWESVYVTTLDGEEVASLGWIDDAVIERLSAKAGAQLLFTFCGGNMDEQTI